MSFCKERSIFAIVVKRTELFRLLVDFNNQQHLDDLVSRCLTHFCKAMCVHLKVYKL